MTNYRRTFIAGGIFFFTAGGVDGFRKGSTHPCNSEIDYDWPVPKRNGLPRRAFRGRPLAIGSNPS
jgi:hypothetical protein